MCVFPSAVPAATQPKKKISDRSQLKPFCSQLHTIIEAKKKVANRKMAMKNVGCKFDQRKTLLKCRL